jgi:DtxR family Mn-dependent transcriptional regulator
VIEQMANFIKNTKSKQSHQAKGAPDKPLSEKEEEILEHIGKYYEKGEDEIVKRIDLAEILQCSPALVNKLLKSLERRNLILHRKYGEIRLTNEGFKLSIALIRKHRLSEALFVDLLGMDAADAHEFACKFEHIMDERLANRIEEVLNHPRACPHGNPIPSEAKYSEIIAGSPLSEFSVDDYVVVSQIRRENTDFLKKLAQIGIEVGTKIRILQKSPVDGTLLLEINSNHVSLGDETARNLIAVLLIDKEV